jgi:branched-chain amino acid transport system substrate-binding protein
MGLRRIAVAGLGVAAAATVLGACGSSGNSGSSGGSGSGQKAAQATSGTAIAQRTIDLAATYVGGKAGKADPSLPPLKIGFTNQQGGSPAFPEQAEVADATVKFINEHLGGVGGHPVALDKCIVVSEEDGQKCGAQFLNGGTKVGNQGLTVVGNASYYKTVKGKFPIIVSGQGGGADVTTDHVYLLDPGGAAMIGNMATIASKLGAKNIAVVAADNPAGKFAIQQLLDPAIKKLGITAKTVFVADTGTTPDYASALSATGASKADAVMVIVANVGGCTSAFDAMRQLGIKNKVISTYTCYGDPMPDHAGSALSNWYFSGFTTNPRIASDSQATAYRNVMTAYGKQKAMFQGTGLKEFQDLLLIAKFANELGFNGVTNTALDQKIRTYRGPGFLVAGTLACDGKTAGQPGVCAKAATASTFKNGAFVSFGTA